MVYLGRGGPRFLKEIAVLVDQTMQQFKNCEFKLSSNSNSPNKPFEAARLRAVMEHANRCETINPDFDNGATPIVKTVTAEKGK